jgi:effector-binding domain-containing protein
MTQTKIHKESGIEHRHYGETLVASRRLTIQARGELPATLARLAREVPAKRSSAAIAGPPFVLFYFITSVEDGSDVEVAVPVTRPIETAWVSTRLLPALEVLSLRHRGPLETLRESYAKLYGAAYKHGLISDEFCREVYLDIRDPADCEVEVQFIVHNWNALLARNVERVLGAAGRAAVMQGSEAVDVETALDDRFHWVKGAVARLDRLAEEGQTYDVLSSCAHVFPAEQVAKLRAVYQEARVRTGDPLQAVDAVIAFMDRDPGWPAGTRREGRIVYAAKKPRDPGAYEKAQTEAEKRQAYCFCPIIRSHLDGGMSPSFCYCGAGWYRRQWEGALGRPVTIEVAKSILRGDDVCQFAIHLPDEFERQGTE